MKRFFLCICIIMLSSSSSSLCSIKEHTQNLIKRLTTKIALLKQKLKTLKKNYTHKRETRKKDLPEPLVQPYIEQNKILMQNWKLNWKATNENLGKSLLNSYNNVWKYYTRIYRWPWDGRAGYHPGDSTNHLWRW